MSDEKKAPPNETSTLSLTKRLSDLVSKFGGCCRDCAYGIPGRYLPYPLRTFPLDWGSDAIEFLEGAETLFLHGAIGSRKTAFATAILRAWRWAHPEDPEDWRNGIFLPMYRAADALRSMETGKEERDEWKHTPLLVLDDLGAARSTPHIAEQLLFLLEYRYDWALQTIVTTNLTLAEFADAVDPRAASRLQQGMVLDLGSKDWRQGE